MSDELRITVRRLSRVIDRMPGGRRFVRGSGRRVHELWVEQRLDDEWMAAFRIGQESGRPVVTEVRVFPFEREHDPGRWGAEVRGSDASAPTGGVPASVLRRLRLGVVIEALAEVPHMGSKTWDFVLANEIGITDIAHAPRRPGRGGRDDAFYAKVAAQYVALLERGSRSPIVDLTRDLQGEGAYFAAESVRQLVHVARRRGMLTPSPRGRAGGELTAKALRTLRSTTPRRGRKR